MQSTLKHASHKLSADSVVCLMAPTASGKTALAYELYDTGRYEIISVDSALIYRDMTIGTAKPTTSELIRYPHHLVNIIDPTQSYSVTQFIRDVEHVIAHCHNRGKIPLLVGGTMMYYMALIEGLSPVPESDDKVRDQVEQWRQSEGISDLYDYLADVDPESHQRLMSSDTQRITRAVEVYKQTGTPISSWQHQPKVSLMNDSNQHQHWHILSVMPERKWLHERINQRLEIMWDQGFVAEVIGLVENYKLTPNMPSMRCVGYRQVLEYLVNNQHPVFETSHLDKQSFYNTFASNNINAVEDKIEREALAYKIMKDKSLFATRQLAKRQYTWLRKLSQPTVSANSNAIIQVFESMQSVKDYIT